MGKLVLIDGNAILHRAFHALPPLTTKKGEPTGAVYGFLLALFRVIKDIKPHYVAACFDSAAPTFRKEKFKEYKANRPKTPDELVCQIHKTKEVLDALGIPHFAKDGIEADDLIATICQKMSAKKDLMIYILTGDLDNLQLVSENVKVYTLGKGIKDIVVYNKEKIAERFKITPEQVIDFKALTGDASDNIPGVPGVGEKTASALLQKFGNLENVFKNIEDDSIKPSIKKALAENKERAFLAKELVQMKKDVDMDFDLKVFGSSFDESGISDLFKSLEFFTMIDRAGEIMKNKPIKKQSKLL